MASYLKKFELLTEVNGVHPITEQVIQTVADSGIASGLCIVFCPHSTSGIAVSSFIDPKGLRDISEEIDRIVPSRVDFHHQNDTPSDASGHVKTALFGVSLNLIVEKNKPLLGSSQGVLYLEYDGPRNRQFYVKVISDT